MEGGIAVRLEKGTVVLVDLDPVRGHEQRSTRPCVVVEARKTNEGLLAGRGRVGDVFHEPLARAHLHELAHTG